MSSILLQARGRHTSSWDTDNTTITTAILALSFHISSLPTANHPRLTMENTSRFPGSLYIAGAENCKAAMASSPPSIPLVLMPPTKHIRAATMPLPLSPSTNIQRYTNDIPRDFFLLLWLHYSRIAFLLTMPSLHEKKQAPHAIWREINS